MQFGFRKNHSTEMATCYLFEKIKKNIDSGSAVGAVFLDLSKAFDTVNHSVLLSKVSNFNLSVETMNLMESYLTGRKQCTRVGDRTSSFIGCSVGVPQGSILGPLLFSLYVNYLALVLYVQKWTYKCMQMTRSSSHMERTDVKWPPN